MALEERGITMRDILTDAALRNAMVTHAAFGGSTNLHPPHPGDRARRGPAPADGRATGRTINRRVPRIVDALPEWSVGITRRSRCFSPAACPR